jgi:hypothetical protein
MPTTDGSINDDEDVLGLDRGIRAESGGEKGPFSLEERSLLLPTARNGVVMVQRRIVWTIVLLLQKPCIDNDGLIVVG